MSYKIILQPSAEVGIIEAHDYIAERAPEAADKWVRRLRMEIGTLSEMPGRCSVAPESIKLGFDLRHLLFGKRSGVYRVIFRILETEKEVHVLSVRHGARKPLEPDDLT
ncbi:MAG: type II toxin-antitoxin system RelE/ParE family toxin [Fimbriimonadaceae bacterium]|nr:type II toxin-antitoxin system RelE/ParE family toxin [Fimbriimonadaceae bacterium]